MRKRLFTKKFSKEKLARFFDKEGFYVVVFLCVAIIATTAVYVTRNNMDYFSQGDTDEIADNYEDHEYYQPEDIEPVNEDDNQSVANTDDEEELEESQEEVAEDEEEKEQVIDKNMIPENATAVISTNTESSQESNGGSAKDILNKLQNPVESTSITMDYSFQSLPVFSATLDEYRSDHQGIDISAEKGTLVKASMDGKVIDIVQDPRLGMMITIDHGSGVMTKYGNLDSNVTVTKNQQVKCGDTLGKVGNTAMFEIEDEPHVHFEVWDGDEPVDPKDCIDDLKISDSDNE
jgi:murein DD-endopeptidase MepM/ murein hydrolase activator NlpD